MTDFGHTAIGSAGTDNPARNYVWIGPFTPASAGTLTSISCHCVRFGTQSGGGSTIDFALYSNSGGAPSALIVAGVTPVTVGASVAWVTQTGFSQAITAIPYWFGIRLPNEGPFTGNNDALIDYDTNGGATNLYFKDAEVSGAIAAFPATTAGASSAANLIYSIYGTYTPSGGSQTVNPGFISAASSVFAPTLSYKIFAGFISAASVIFAPSVSGGATVSPALVGPTATVYAPSFTPGAVAVSPGFIGAASTVYVPSVGANLPQHVYATTFSATENPMSENGIWTQGLANGLDWQNVNTGGGIAYGTESGTFVDPDPRQYDDSTAILKGTFGADQYAEATISGVGHYGTSSAEVELRLRSTVTAHSSVGIEIEQAVNLDNYYFDVVLWNGALGDFTSKQHLTTGDGLPVVANGDKLRAYIIGNILSVYINSTLVTTLTDAAFGGVSGNPGVGFFYRERDTVVSTSTYGFTDFAAQTVGFVFPSLVGPGSQVFAPKLNQQALPSFIGVGSVVYVPAATVPQPQTVNPSFILSGTLLYAPFVHFTGNDVGPPAVRGTAVYVQDIRAGSGTAVYASDVRTGSAVVA